MQIIGGKINPVKTICSHLPTFLSQTQLGTFKVAYIKNLLQPAESKHHPVYPQDNRLLNITYERSDLAKYDDLI